MVCLFFFFFFQAEDGIRDFCLSRGLGDVYKRQEQSFCGVAKDSESNIIVGLYILHPNNVGRCGHISNASFAVSSSVRGYGVGEILVKHCIEQARKLGFKILQFNAVVKSNTAALKLYKKLGFIQLGIIPNGFLLPNGTYEDIIPHYISL